MSRPFNTISMSNGWTLEEYTTELQKVYVKDDLTMPGTMGRFTVRFVRIPSSRTVRVIYLSGTSPEDNPWAPGVAAGIARGKNRALPWRRRRLSGTRRWYFTVVLGHRINEAEEFEKLRRGALTDDAVDLVFKSIVQHDASRSEGVEA